MRFQCGLGLQHPISEAIKRSLQEERIRLTGAIWTAVVEVRLMLRFDNLMYCLGGEDFTSL
jgi:hypothetical protein